MEPSTDVRLDLEEIIREEINIYGRLAHLEEQKCDAIIARSGKDIQDIARHEELLLLSIATLEKSREEWIVMNQECVPVSAEPVTLAELACSFDEVSASRLLNIGAELKKILSRIESLHQTNKKLLDDNLEFFNLLISNLKYSSAVHHGYSERGKENQTGRSAVLFNQTV